MTQSLPKVTVNDGPKDIVRFIPIRSANGDEVFMRKEVLGKNRPLIRHLKLLQGKANDLGDNVRLVFTCLIGMGVGLLILLIMQLAQGFSMRPQPLYDAAITATEGDFVDTEAISYCPAGNLAFA